MKHYLSLVGVLVALVIGLLVAYQYLNFSHRIVIRNDSGSEIATAQIALPSATFLSSDSFTGRWTLESWADEFPKKGTSTDDYRATRKGGDLRVNLNPQWADNNVVLTGKQVGTTYQGDWCYQTYFGCQATGSFEIIPISGSPASSKSGRSLQ